MLKHIKESEFNEAVLNSDKCILVDFFATWCMPCKMLGSVLEEIANEREDFDIVKINIDEEQNMAIKYEIEAVPTMLVFKNGELKKKVEGYLPKEELLNEIQNFI